MSTLAPPPASTPVGGEDIPGVTRRHNLKDFYHERTNFQFIKHSKRWAILSGTLILIAILAFVFRGLNLSIEFEGGSAWQVTMADGKDASVTEVRDLLEPLGFADSKITTLSGQGDESVRVQAETIEDPIRGIQDALAETAGLEEADVVFARTDDGGGSFTITLGDSEATQEDFEQALTAADAPESTVTVADGTATITFAELPTSPLQDVAEALADYAGVDVSEVSISTVGPTWGETVSRNALRALLVFFLLLAIYLSFRFEWKMAASSIIAVIHDIIVSVGVYALFRFEVTPATVTAFLTILGFSLYDTVVVFDKVRENEKLLVATGRATYPEMVNRSLNAVLMRSLSTTLVALLPVLSLLIVGSLIMGATALEEFALALAVGLFIGAYSSIFVAAPILAAWKNREPQYRALADRKQRTTLAAASVATGIPVVPGVASVDDELDERPSVVSEGIPGPPAVGRTVTPRPRQQRRRKRK